MGQLGDCVNLEEGKLIALSPHSPWLKIVVSTQPEQSPLGDGGSPWVSAMYRRRN